MLKIWPYVSNFAVTHSFRLSSSNMDKVKIDRYISPKGWASETQESLLSVITQWQWNRFSIKPNNGTSLPTSTAIFKNLRWFPNQRYQNPLIHPQFVLDDNLTLWRVKREFKHSTKSVLMTHAVEGIQKGNGTSMFYCSCIAKILSLLKFL